MMIRVFLIGLMFVSMQSQAYDSEDCIDGNTCHVTSDAYTGPAKLLCVDAPTLLQHGGRQARDALLKEMRGTVRVLMDSQDNGVPIAEFIRDDGFNLGLELIRSGLAKVDRRYCDEVEYLMSEQFAQSSRLGLWAEASGFKK